MSIWVKATSVLKLSLRTSKPDNLAEMEIMISHLKQDIRRVLKAKCIGDEYLDSRVIIQYDFVDKGRIPSLADWQDLILFIHGWQRGRQTADIIPLLKPITKAILKRAWIDEYHTVINDGTDRREFNKDW